MKKILTLTLSLFTMGLFAQDNEKEQMIADFERSRAMTLAYIEAMPEAAYTEKPADGSRSFAEQMLHIAQGTVNLMGNGTGKERIFSSENLEKNPVYHTKAEVIRLMNESYDFALDGIKNMTGELNEVIDRGPFKITRKGWIMKANEHISHHRGQCAVYLRLQDVTPPQYQLF